MIWQNGAKKVNPFSVEIPSGLELLQRGNNSLKRLWEPRSGN